MKKTIFAFVAVLFIGAIVAAYLSVGNLNELIRQQLITQGSQLTGTSVQVAKVELDIIKGKGEIQGFSLANPQGFSDSPLMKTDVLRLIVNPASAIEPPVSVDEVLIQSPLVRYEVNAQGKGNINVLLNNLKSDQPSQPSTTEQESAPMDTPKMMAKRVAVTQTQLVLDLTALGGKVYEETLPDFVAENIGVPEGLPPQELGKEIAKAMLARIADEAEKKQKEKLKNKVKDKIEEKIKDKLGSFLEKLGN